MPRQGGGRGDSEAAFRARNQTCRQGVGSVIAYNGCNEIVFMVDWDVGDMIGSAVALGRRGVRCCTVSVGARGVLRRLREARTEGMNPSTRFERRSGGSLTRGYLAGASSSKRLLTMGYCFQSL